MFGLILAAGLCVIGDYGISTDEPAERNTLLVNALYILQKIHVNISSSLPRLRDYNYRYYGVFLQSPAIIGELAAGEGEYGIYKIRHLYTFFFCVSGYFAFYRVSMRVLKSRKLSLIGTVMLAFYPRFFAEQFYNIKDLMFASAWCWCLLVSILVVQSGFRTRYLVLFAIVTAMASNCRFVAMVFPALLLIWFLYEHFSRNRSTAGRLWKGFTREVLLPAALTFLTFLCTYIVISPILWEHPIKGIPAVIACFSDYGGWHGTIHFMGKVIADSVIPWYYIPLWILISVPLWYLFFVIAESVFFLRNFFAGAWRDVCDIILRITKNPFALYANLASFLPWIATVVMHSTIYNAWRHFYFLMPCLILDALLGIRHIELTNGRLRFIERATVTLGLAMQLLWIIRFHPFEMTYFNGIGRFVAEDFDRDYWHMSKDALVSEIIRKENGNMNSWSVTVPNSYFQYKYPAGRFNGIRFVENAAPEKDWNSLNTDYVILDYHYSNGETADIPGYKEIYSIRVDGYKIASLLSRDDRNTP